MPKIAVIVPCFNESQRFPAHAFEQFLAATPGCDLFFVDDGSTDQTNLKLEILAGKCAFSHIHLLRLHANSGKAAAVRAGVLHALDGNEYDRVGYLDADLSTSPQELMRLDEKMRTAGAAFVYGARIKKLDSDIDRSFFRHLSGRLIATLIDLRFRLGIYDTQCGAKCFQATLAREIFKDPFQTRWLFDVELLLRIRRSFPEAKGIEEPLVAWQDKADSKLRARHAGLVAREIITLFKSYRPR